MTIYVHEWENLFITRMVGSNTHLRLTQCCFGVKLPFDKCLLRHKGPLCQIQVRGSTDIPSSDGFSPIPTYQEDHVHYIQPPLNKKSSLNNTMSNPQLTTPYHR